MFRIRTISFPGLCDLIASRKDHTFSFLEFS
jgi:hypothetical protein